MFFQCYSLNWIITKNKTQFGPGPILGAVQLSDLKPRGEVVRKSGRGGQSKKGQKAPSNSNMIYFPDLFSLSLLVQIGEKLLKMGQFEAPESP